VEVLRSCSPFGSESCVGVCVGGPGEGEDLGHDVEQQDSLSPGGVDLVPLHRAVGEAAQPEAADGAKVAIHPDAEQAVQHVGALQALELVLRSPDLRGGGSGRSAIQDDPKQASVTMGTLIHTSYEVPNTPGSCKFCLRHPSTQFPRPQVGNQSLYTGGCKCVPGLNLSNWNQRILKETGIDVWTENVQ